MLRKASILLPLVLLAACSSAPPGLAPLMDAPATLANGDTVQLRTLCGARATVVVTLDPECPFSQLYATTLDSLSRAYAPRGVAFVGLYPSIFIDAAAVRRFNTDARLDFAQVLDADCLLACALDARITPEAFVLDPKAALLYHGAIDDTAVRPGRKKLAATRTYLADALEALLAGGKLPAEVKAVGCIVECDRP